MDDTRDDQCRHLGIYSQFLPKNYYYVIILFIYYFTLYPLINGNITIF